MKDYEFMGVDKLLSWEEEVMRCRKHPSRPLVGVCPFCLRDSLLLLCPECARARPCSCSPSVSSSSSSFSSFSSFDLPRSGSVSGIGAVGRVSHLIEKEPAFQRSQSVVIPFLRSQSVAAAQRPTAKKGWAAALWPFWRSRERAPPETVERSRSVAVEAAKAWGWHFPSPIKAFRHQKTAKVVVVQERSPSYRR